MAKTFPIRTAIEREIERLKNPTGMQLNDGKERVILPGGTLQHLLRMLDADADRIADLERQIAELRQPTAQQVEDAAIGQFLMGLAKQNSATSWPRLHKIEWCGYAVTNEDDGYRNWTLREALAIAALQAGKEKE